MKLIGDEGIAEIQSYLWESRSFAVCVKTDDEKLLVPMKIYQVEPGEKVLLKR